MPSARSAGRGATTGKRLIKGTGPRMKPKKPQGSRKPPGYYPPKKAK